MVKKPTGQRPTGVRSRSAGAIVPAIAASGGQLVPVSDPTDGSVVRDRDVTMVVGQPYVMGDRSVLADAVYYVGAGRTRRREAELGGADKIAWRDHASGYDCIIMRDELRGHLSGYVAVPPGHPLYGYDHDAVPPDLDIEVHGGLTYSAICKEGPTPRRRLIWDARTVCHVERPLRHATDYRAGHDRVWWFGFECNHVYDIVPNDRGDRSRFLGRETGGVFRDEAYVYDQVVDLAAQLRAIADGRPKPPRTGMPPPALGLDPKRAG